MTIYNHQLTNDASQQEIGRASFLKNNVGNIAKAAAITLIALAVLGTGIITGYPLLAAGVALGLEGSYIAYKFYSSRKSGEKPVATVITPPIDQSLLPSRSQSEPVVTIDQPPLPSRSQSEPVVTLDQPPLPSHSLSKPVVSDSQEPVKLDEDSQANKTDSSVRKYALPAAIAATAAVIGGIAYYAFRSSSEGTYPLYPLPARCAHMEPGTPEGIARAFDPIRTTPNLNPGTAEGIANAFEASPREGLPTCPAKITPSLNPGTADTFRSMLYEQGSSAYTYLTNIPSGLYEQGSSTFTSLKNSAREYAFRRDFTIIRSTSPAQNPGTAEGIAKAFESFVPERLPTSPANVTPNLNPGPGTDEGIAKAFESFVPEGLPTSPANVTPNLNPGPGTDEGIAKAFESFVPEGLPTCSPGWLSKISEGLNDIRSAGTTAESSYQATIKRGQAEIVRGEKMISDGQSKAKKGLSIVGRGNLIDQNGRNWIERGNSIVDSGNLMVQEGRNLIGRGNSNDITSASTTARFSYLATVERGQAEMVRGQAEMVRGEKMISHGLSKAEKGLSIVDSGNLIVQEGRNLIRGGNSIVDNGKSIKSSAIYDFHTAGISSIFSGFRTFYSAFIDDTGVSSFVSSTWNQVSSGLSYAGAGMNNAASSTHDAASSAYTYLTNIPSWLYEQGSSTFTSLKNSAREYAFRRDFTIIRSTS
ncbi:MAG: hypothetical protein WAM28_06965, partial [Chlamydiales bacterium]